MNALLGAEANTLKTAGVSLTLGGLPDCPTDVIYIAGSCRARIHGVAGDSYIWLDLYDITFKMSYAPVEMSVYLPTEEQVIQWAICQFSSDMAQEMDAAAQVVRAESDLEAAAFAQSGGSTIMCEHVMNVGNRELCIDLFIQERRIGAPFTFGAIVGMGDNRGFDPDAPRKESRVQINIDPETLALNAFINGSTVEILGGWTRTYGGDGTVIIQNDGPSHDWPANVRQLSFSRLNGDPNTAVLQYNVANNVCGNWSQCPTITGRWVFNKNPAGVWVVNTAQSRTDTFPSQSVNRYDPAGGVFRSVLEIPEDVKAKLKGLDDFQQIDGRIRAEQTKLFIGTGCNGM